MATVSSTMTLDERRKRAQVQAGKAGIYIFLTVFTLIWLLPVIAAFITSFRTMDDISTHGFWSLPSQLILRNFVQAWTVARVSKYLINSFIIFEFRQILGWLCP
jgi:ABC-type glycerol-3-phosphate transport system permease component